MIATKSESELLKRAQPTAAFTLVETLVSTAIVAIFFVALYTGITQGFSLMANAREGLRANQILLDKMEEMRLYTWDQINSFGTTKSFIPTNFTESYYPTNNSSLQTVSTGTSTNAADFKYYGSINVTNVAFTNAAYVTNLRRVIVSVTWTNGAKVFNHEMSTIVSQYGIQKYIY